MYTMTLFNTRTGWMVHHTDPAIRELFHTDTLPSGFTQRAPAATVLARIRELNPDRLVRLSDGAGPRAGGSV